MELIVLLTLVGQNDRVMIIRANAYVDTIHERIG